MNPSDKKEPVQYKRPAGVKILSGAGGEYAAGATLRNKVCLLSDGTLLVSETHYNAMEVNSYKSFLQRANVKFVEKYVPLAFIADVYAGGGADAATEGVPATEGGVSSAMRDLAYKIFARAHSSRASDIHIIVDRANNSAKILFRVDGSLKFIVEEDARSGEALCRAIFQSLADVSETTFDDSVAQDARIGSSKDSRLPNGVDGIRIATGPLVGGFQMVLRLLSDMTGGNYNIERLGYLSQQSSRIRQTSRRPYGLALLSGPTGSGKSTTLMCVLNSLAQEEPGLNIISVEDPPEYKLLCRQMPVSNAKDALERAEVFGKAIRAAMRLDPDVIMIGETRDKASVDLVLQAAATGHLVWTTVHANTALLTIRRMLDLGAEPALVTDPEVVLMMGCQRLVKVLCPDCSREFFPAYLENPSLFPRWEGLSGAFNSDEVHKIRVLRDPDHYDPKKGGKPCTNPLCKNGVVGRSVVSEVVVPDERIMEYLRQGRTYDAVMHWKTTLGGISMEDHAIRKVLDGKVDPFSVKELARIADDCMGSA